jgi:hypothetical protein
MKPIKRTKRLEALLKKYRVTLRTSNSVVEHQTYRTKTTVPPLEFAVFEAAVKAVDASWVAAQFGGHDRQWNQHLAAINGFDLLDEITPGFEATRDYAKDYHYFCKLLKEAGLYYDLLD